MRRLFTGFVVAAIAAVAPTLALAGNQEVANQIAKQLRSSGQMSDYKIGVKFQDGTAWLRGQVTSDEQMNMAIRLTFKIAAVDRVVNELNVATNESSDAGQQASDANPLRESGSAGQAKQPRRLGLAKRLEAAVHNEDETSQSAVRPVANEEPEELPPQEVQQPRPVARNSYRIARMQAEPRGPMAPNGAPLPMYRAGAPANAAPATYDKPCMPNYAWPSYAAYPNYAAVTYPKQYSPAAWPYIGPFYPYPQVPLGWRKVTLEWDSGWWFLDFKDQPASCWRR